MKQVSVLGKALDLSAKEIIYEFNSETVTSSNTSSFIKIDKNFNGSYMYMPLMAYFQLHSGSPNFTFENAFEVKYYFL